MSVMRTCLMILLATAVVGCGPSTPVKGGGEPVASGVAFIGGPFNLVDQDGRPQDQRLLNGKWSALFFGYTYCPDICPTTLQALAQTKAQLGGAAKDLQIVFVSVDPERDTPAQIKAYLQTPAFAQPTIGLTGTPEQVAAAVKAYRVVVQKQGTGEGYTVNHTAVIYLMDPKGQFDRPITETLSPAEMAAQIRDAMKAGPKVSS